MAVPYACTVPPLSGILRLAMRLSPYPTRISSSGFSSKPPNPRDWSYHPQWLAVCFVKKTFLVVHPHQILQLANRSGERLEISLPLGQTVGIHSDDGDGHVDGLFSIEIYLGVFDEVVRSQTQLEAHLLSKRRIRLIAIADRARPGGYVQARFQLQAVVLELDFGLLKGHVGAALHVRTAFPGIVEASRRR